VVPASVVPYVCLKAPLTGATYRHHFRHYLQALLTGLYIQGKILAILA